MIINHCYFCFYHCYYVYLFILIVVLIFSIIGIIVYIVIITMSIAIFFPVSMLSVSVQFYPIECGSSSVEQI